MTSFLRHLSPSDAAQLGGPAIMSMGIRWVGEWYGSGTLLGQDILRAIIPPGTLDIRVEYQDIVEELHSLHALGIRELGEVVCRLAAIDCMRSMCYRRCMDKHGMTFKEASVAQASPITVRG